ncbi:hypothetical protein HYV43_06070 [Candidatus Micrarchaeota archaeon]|nr:hypothetical protein [Candidatus Micrarchaeota archaeon]
MLARTPTPRRALSVGCRFLSDRCGAGGSTREAKLPHDTFFRMLFPSCPPFFLSFFWTTSGNPLILLSDSVPVFRQCSFVFHPANPESGFSFSLLSAVVVSQNTSSLCLCMLKDIKKDIFINL